MLSTRDALGVRFTFTTKLMCHRADLKAALPKAALGVNAARVHNSDKFTTRKECNMNTPNVNETQMPASPPPRQRGQRCPCCGDYRLSVIVVDGIIMFLNALALIIISVGDDGEDALQSYGFAGNGILSVVSLVMAPISIWGAVIANTYLVLANAIWLPIGYIAGIALVASYCQDDYVLYGRSYCDGSQLAWILANKLVVGAITILFMWPHVGFAAKTNRNASSERGSALVHEERAVSLVESTRDNSSGNHGTMPSSEDERHIDVDGTSAHRTSADGTSANEPEPTLPPRTQHAQGSGCCRCCGDYSNALIIVDVFIIIMNVIQLILIAVDEVFLAGALPERPVVILSIVSIVMAAASILGAVSSNAQLVLANALWLPIGYITGIALAASYCKEGCYWTDTYSIVLNKFLFGVAMIFFLWPHVGFVAKAGGRNNGSRVSRGAVTNDAYAEEEYRCCFARTQTNARVVADLGTEGDRSEIDVEAPQTLSGQNMTNAAWGRKHALKIIATVAAVFLVIGLSVGLTQNNEESEVTSDEDVDPGAWSCGQRHGQGEWYYSSEIAGCTDAFRRDTRYLPDYLFDSLRDCCLYHFGAAICRSHATCGGVSVDPGPARPDYDWTDYGSSEDGSEDDGITVRLPDPDECEQSACGVPKYEQGHSDSCGALMSQYDHTNKYWENDNFLCRTNERPCLATSSELTMDFPNGMRVYFDLDSELRDFGPAEVWHFRTDRFGNMIMEPWSSPYQFFADGRWFYDHEEFARGHDFSNYRFPSLQCHSREPDPNNLAFIVIDGVLVDSCPKSVAEKCRAYPDCEAPEYVDGHTSTFTCEALLGLEDHINAYWTNENFLCRTSERPCEATSPVQAMDIGEMSITFDTEVHMFPAEVWRVRANRNGHMKWTPWNSPYQFYSESVWVHEYNDGPGHVFSDYQFGSLRCGVPQDDDDIVFIIVDGVLVDSCPKRFAENCRACVCSTEDDGPPSSSEDDEGTEPSADFGEVSGVAGVIRRCDRFMAQDNRTNSYWKNENFLCRTNERPCEATSPELHLNLGNGMNITFDAGRPDLYDFGPTEVWHVRTDANGTMKVTPWNSPYRFYGEGRWFSDADTFAVGEDLDNYYFGSLACLGPQDDDDFVFIVIDGVLVDSCPKSVAEECRVCDSRQC
ncbi:hypothetical protein ACHAXT_011131 [Thalassiosira profunda]